MSLKNFNQDPSFLGSMLFLRSVSGTRILDPSKTATVSGIEFQGYGCHTNHYPFPFVTCACAIGETRDEIDLFLERLGKCWKDFQKKINKNTVEKETKENKN